MFNKILQSSQNPDEVSLTVKGVLMNIVAIIVFVAGNAGYNVIGDLNGLVESISAGVGITILLIGQFQLAWGLMRKIALKKK